MLVGVPFLLIPLARFRRSDLPKKIDEARHISLELILRDLHNLTSGDVG
jgi:hypothetical protein